MLTYKFDVMTALKSAGYSTYKIRKEKIFGQTTIQKLNRKIMVNVEVIDTLCGLLKCQPGDIIEYSSKQNTEA